ncbi:Phophatidylserine decarboxylase-domain-containing protein [Mycena vulgaris]|nr:Phophatidylserine decarboxylase-domain-containing protein [Mycena vulgaris]
MDTTAVDPTDYASLPVLPEIEELKKFIESDSQMYMMFNLMFMDDNVPNYQRMLQIINKWLQQLPIYFEIDDSPTLVLTHAMNTHAGFSAFLKKKLNGYLKRLFDRWGIYLTTPASANVLTAGKGGGFSKLALAGMMEHFKGLTFEQVFVSHPAAPHYGFTCWNDLFTRKLCSGIRPVEHRESPDIISAACESQYYNVATNVKKRDTFWLNGQSYSSRDMLVYDELVPHLVGGMQIIY